MRFIIADIFLGEASTILSHNLYSYCTNSPVASADYNGYQKILVIYDGRSSGIFYGLLLGVGFEKQGRDLVITLRKQGHNVDACKFINIEQFVEQWNSSDYEYDSIYILCHGAPGSLDCSRQRIRSKAARGDDVRQVADFDDLNEKKVNEMVHLWCCNAGTPDKFNTNSMREICMRTGCTVEGVGYGGINIDYRTGRAYPKNGGWMTWTPVLNVNN